MSARHCAERLRVNYFNKPLGIDDPTPRFFWRMNDERPGACQTAYQIVVSTNAKTVWDTGKVESANSIQIAYTGPDLQPRTSYTWKVKIWDHENVESDEAESTFETGLMKTTWDAAWVSAPKPAEALYPTPFLRKEFQIEKPVKRARVYATAQGLYELHINGSRVGHDNFTPGWTYYPVRFQYQTYNVTNCLNKGNNALCSMLAGGWFHGYICGAYKQEFDSYGQHPAFMAQLMIDFEDGSSMIVATDASWQWKTGHILHSDIYMGEKQNLKLKLYGWDQPGHTGTGWQPVVVCNSPTGSIDASRGPAVKHMHTVKPVEITEPAKGVYVVNMGQNMVGWIRLTLSGHAGKTVTIRHAERLNPDGTMYTANLRSAKALAEYTLDSDSPTVLEPHFTFFGFQYVELTGLSFKPTLETIEGIVLYTEMEQTGEFECSNTLVNQLYSNIQWGQRGNYLDVPTDCPQRDERLGWTGDAQVFVRTASYCTDIAGFFTKWMYDLSDSQHEDGRVPDVAPTIPKAFHGSMSAWADAQIICPLTIYRAYGDKQILADHYSNIKRYMLWQRSISPDWIRDGGWTGDWLHINDDTPHVVLGTAFFAGSARLAGEIASILGYTDDREEFALWTRNICEKFNAEFVTPASRIIGDSQTAYILALYFDVLPEEKRAAAANHLVRRIDENKGKLSCGFVGSPYINHVLTRFGKLDKAYQLLNNTDWPSWLYAVTKGATTIWERWNGWTEENGFGDPGMNSFNHYAYGAIGDWLFSTVAGIAWDQTVPGYRSIVLAPRPGGDLTHARASYKSIQGTIVSAWRIDGNTTTYEFTVPANTTATIVLPTPSPGKVTIAEGKATLSSGTAGTNGVQYSAVSGTYQLVVKN